MKTIKRSITMLLLIALCMPLALAQPAQDKQREARPINPVAQDVLIIIQQEQVRFTARRGVTEMQLQIFDQAGQLVYDSGAVTDPELKWDLQQAGGEAVKSGLYGYTLSVKEAGAETARVRRGHFIVDRARERDGKTDRLWITSQNESGVGTELTVARNENVTIAGASAPGEHKGMRGADDTARDGEGAAHNGGSESKDGTLTAMADPISGTPGMIPKFITQTELGDSLIIERDGSIGVGTVAPKGMLEVAGNWDGQYGALTISGDKPTIRFFGGAISGSQQWLLHQGSDGGGSLQFFNGGTTGAWKNVMSLTPNGTVGIGTTSPMSSSRLHVVGNSTATAVWGETASGTGVVGYATDGSGVVGVAGPNGYAGDFRGTVKVRGNLIPADYGMFNLGEPPYYYWRAVYALNGTIQTSDARLKTGVTDLRYGLRELMQLRPVTFEWKDHSDRQRHLGLIAQETEQIIPEAVMRTANADTPLGMNYTTLIPVVIRAIQEQQSALTTLKNENETLQQRNAALQRQNADLDARLMALEQTIEQFMAAAVSDSRDQATAASSVSQGDASLKKEKRGQAQR
jgi:hypothetical protein